MPSQLHNKIDWAIKKSNELFDADDKEGAERVARWIAKIYPGNRIPAWARNELKIGDPT